MGVSVGSAGAWVEEMVVLVSAPPPQPAKTAAKSQRTMSSQDFRMN